MVKCLHPFRNPSGSCLRHLEGYLFEAWNLPETGEDFLWAKFLCKKHVAIGILNTFPEGVGRGNCTAQKKLFLPSLWSTGGGEALIIPAFPLSVAAKQKDPWPSWHATMLSKLLLLLCFSKSHRAVHGEHRKKGNWWEVYIGLGERNDINFSYWVHITCQKLECNIHVPSKPVLNKLGLLLSQLCLGCLLNAWTL